MNKHIYSLLIIFVLMPLVGRSQHALNGTWEGAIKAGQQQIGIIFHIEKDSANYRGIMDIPQQGAKGIPLSPIRQERDSVFISFTVGQAEGNFLGMFESDSVISGTYYQGRSATGFYFSVDRIKKKGPK